MAENSGNEHGSPFRASLIDTHLGDKGKINRLKRVPGKIVRDVHLGPQRLSEVTAGKILIEELRDKFGINIPPFDIVFGKNDAGQPSVFTIADRVRGKNLKDLEITSDNRDEVLGKLDEHYRSLSNYLKHKQQYSNESYLVDIVQDDQYLLGRLAGDKEDKIYLVDLDMLWASPNNDIKPPLSDMLINEADSLLDSIVNMESKLPGVRFSAARTNLLQVYVRENETSPNALV